MASGKKIAVMAEDDPIIKNSIMSERKQVQNDTKPKNKYDTKEDRDKTHINK